MPFAWTPEAEKLLRKLFEDGKSASQSAASLMERFGGKVTRNSVIGKRHRLGMTNTRARGKAVEELKEEKKKKEPPKPVTVLAPVIIPELKKVVIPATARVKLLDLGVFDCRYPIGDPLTSDFTFCGARAKTGFPYCESHHRVCYKPLKSKAWWDKKLFKQAKRAA